MTARAVFVMHKAAAHNFSTSKYKALRRMRLCSGRLQVIQIALL